MANIDVSLLGRVYYWLCWWNIWYWVVCQNNSIINMLIRLILMLNKFIWNMHFCPLCWRIFFTVYLFRLEGVHIQRILVPIQELLKIAHSCFLSRGLPFWTLHCLKISEVASLCVWWLMVWGLKWIKPLPFIH